MSIDYRCSDIQTASDKILELVATDGIVSVLNLGTVVYPVALSLMKRLADARRKDEVGDLLLLVQHPPVITLGRGGGLEDLRISPVALRQMGIRVIQTDRGGRATYHGPGQLVAYPILRLPEHDLHGYIHRLEETVIRLLAKNGVQTGRIEGHPGVWLDDKKIAAIGVAVQAGVTSHGLALNLDPLMTHFEYIIPCGLADKGVTSVKQATGQILDFEKVAIDFAHTFAQVFGIQLEWGIQRAPWLLALAPQGKRVDAIGMLLDSAHLHTVCEEALCPNLGECWGRGTATFMILGNICTRHCRFCAVEVGRPLAPNPNEPLRLAQTAARMGLRHVVITSVARDDLPDGGAAHFSAVINAIRHYCPAASVEVLVPDFGGNLASIQNVLSARPDIFNHNLETVPRLYPRVQPRKDYRRALAVIEYASRSGLRTKSGLMLGLGERRGEVLSAMRDLHHAGCEILTLGQYLQPSNRHMPVTEYIHPAEFAWYKETGLEMGFRAVAAGPLVRSSYHADEVWEHTLIDG